ncbi:MAG: hypothetical protein Unbinned4098contig1000_28 [Prokaryotic dsDNA virus sp.]|nr:MAG: hypothetical protein Unbinned4098contig1000_28 [Prokaryotic dsDNA virus sp.]|tara:strand:- start:6682 stop:9210 length:2529 start_codon:yes stop_codon:yes gene_type:complete
MAYNPKSRIAIVVDEVNDSPFVSTKRRVIGIFSDNIVSCDWTYNPASGGLKDASIKLKLARSTNIRKQFDNSRFGVVSIYRCNHLAELPLSSSYVDVTQNFDNNERSYFLFQGVAENLVSSNNSDIVSFKLKGYGSFLKEMEYTGTFTDASIGSIYTTVMTDVISRSNQPIKSYTNDSLTISSGVPASYNCLHKVVIGTREYKNAKVSKILKDLQDEAGGEGVVSFGVRCGATADNYGEAYLLEWRGEAWTADFQEDGSTLDVVSHVPYTKAIKLEKNYDTSNIINSVEVYGDTITDGTVSYYGTATADTSISKYGKRHQTISNKDLKSNEACRKYAIAYLKGKSSRKLNTLVSWSDDQTLNESQRVGASTLAKPYDLVHYMRDMNSLIHITNESSQRLTSGSYEEHAGIDSRNRAIKLSKVSSGNAPVINIDTTEAPFYGTSWAGANTFGHPNKEISNAQFSTTRSMLWTVGFGLHNATSDSLNGQVLIEWSKTMRLKFVQSGGANTNFGFTLETWRGSSVGWVDELATYGHQQHLAPSDMALSGGGKVALELSGNNSVAPLVGLWTMNSDGNPTWQTNLHATSSTVGVRFGTVSDHLAYANLAGQNENYILIGSGTDDDGVSSLASTSGNTEIYFARCYEGELNSSTSKFEYAKGLSAEGTSANNSDSFLVSEACRPMPRVEYSAGLLMSLEPAINKTIDSSERYFVKWTRAQNNASGTQVYDGHSNDGFHARLYYAQSGDGVIIGDAITSDTQWNSTTYDKATESRSSTTKIGSEGDFSITVGDGVEIIPNEIKFNYAGKHSPLSITVKGGSPTDSLSKSTSEALERIEQTERDNNSSL